MYISIRFHGEKHFVLFREPLTTFDGQYRNDRETVEPHKHIDERDVFGTASEH